jgi:hypothetical protein
VTSVSVGERDIFGANTSIPALSRYGVASPPIATGAKPRDLIKEFEGKRRLDDPTLYNACARSCSIAALTRQLEQYFQRNHMVDK